MLKSTNKKNKHILLILALFIMMVTISNQGIANQVSDIVKNFERKRILSTVKDYEVLETDRFIIRYNEDIQVANLTHDILDKYYEEVCTMFDYYPEEKTEVVIYNNGEQLLKNTRLKKKSPPLGVYYGGVINILSPRIWISPSENFSYIYEKEGPVIHEFTHLIVDNKTNGNYPLWLTEGTALYIEYVTTGFEWGKNITGHEEITIDDLNNNFKEIDPSLSYRKSFEIVKNISHNQGFDKLMLLLDDLGEGNNINKSTKKILKINLEDIDKDI